MAQPDINAVIKDITADVQTIVKGEIELAKAEMVPQVKRVGVGAGMFGAAGFLALQALNLLFICGGLALTALYWNLVSPVWAFTLGFLTMAVILLVIAGILALIGKSKVKVEKPKQTIDEADRSVKAVKGAVAQGQANVRAIASGRADKPTTTLVPQTGTSTRGATRLGADTDATGPGGATRLDG